MFTKIFCFSPLPKNLFHSFATQFSHIPLLIADEREIYEEKKISITHKNLKKNTCVKAHRKETNFSQWLENCFQTFNSISGRFSPLFLIFSSLIARTAPYFLPCKMHYRQAADILTGHCCICRHYGEMKRKIEDLKLVTRLIVYICNACIFKNKSCM